MTYKELFKLSYQNLNHNKFRYVKNAALMQLLMAFFGTIVLSGIFKLLLIVSGQANLDKTNILKMITNPLGFMVIVFYFIVFSFFMLFEFAFLSLMIHGSINNKYYSLGYTLKRTIKAIRKIINRQFIFFIFYLIISIPIAGLGAGTVFTEQLYIPKFISGEITKTLTGEIWYYTIMFGVLYLNLRFMLLMPLIILNDNCILSNIKKSIELTNKNIFKILTVISIFELILTVIFLVFVIGLTVLFTFINRSGNDLYYQTVYITIINIIIFFFKMYSKLAYYIVIVEFLNNNDDDTDISKNLDEEIKKRELIPVRESLRTKIGTYTVVFLVIGIIGYVAYVTFNTRINSDLKVIGHRGYTRYAVENSLEGLEEAKKAGANLVEMDVLLTKDKKFIVMHDYNLKRLAGVNKRVQDMTFDEIHNLPIYQKGFKSKIPSFEEFVKKAKEVNIKLLVEIKLHGGEPKNYSDLFISEMKRLGIEKEYPCMSLDLKVMDEIEKKSPEIKTGYVIPIQFGNFANDKVDFYVIEEFSYNNSLAIKAQNKNKEVYVWTINDSARMLKYLETPINAIITDEIDDIKNKKREVEKNKGYMEKLFILMSKNF